MTTYTHSVTKNHREVMPGLWKSSKKSFIKTKGFGCVFEDKPVIR